MRKVLLLMLMVGMMVTLSWGYAMAYTGPPYYAERSINGVNYLTGGVGLSERAHMQEMPKDYNISGRYHILKAKIRVLLYIIAP